ncbi:hypothetical protein [Actinoallomurus acaciae]|uniref:Spore-associated protein A n=1 Tax=Actinoallomurus acaciae TaxID=502577 RepID=A0ABV5YJ41_9ACTN
MNIRIKTAMSVVTLASAMVSLAPATSASASVSASCGSGYSYIDSYPLKDPWGEKSSTVKLYLYYNGSTGKNCAYTSTTEWTDTEKYMFVTLSSSSDGPYGDYGYYRYYAGPVYAYARNQCVSLSGGLDAPGSGAGAEKYRVSVHNVHCG